MEETRIDFLLAKYYNGETSLEEEQEIELLLNHNISPKYKTERLLFAGFGLEKLEEPILDFEYPEVHKKSLIGQWIAIAASVLIIMGSLIWLNGVNDRNLSPYQEIILVDTTQNQNKALEETQNALLKISKTLNENLKGLEALESVDFKNLENPTTERK